MDTKKPGLEIDQNLTITLTVGCWMGMAKALSEYILSKYPTPGDIREKAEELKNDTEGKHSQDEYLDIACAIGSAKLVQTLMLGNLMGGMSNEETKHA